MKTARVSARTPAAGVERALPLGVRTPWWRRLPPAYSPLPASAIGRAARDLGQRRDARPALRRALADEFDAAGVALFDSGTHALELAIRLAARLAGGRVPVAIPAYACFDIATAAVAAELPLMLYDVVPRTLEPDPDSLDAVLRAGAGVVVVAPLYGMAVPWDALHAAAERAGAVIVEDAAQGFGSAWRGRAAGRHAMLSVLSFGRGKGWTGGSGGAVLARGHAAARLDDRLSVFPHPESGASTLARAAAMAALVRPPAFSLTALMPWLHLGETRYRAPDQPRRLPRAAASLLLASRDAADREAAVRRAVAAWLLDAVRPLAAVAPVEAVRGADGGYLRLPVRVAHGISGFADPRRARRLGIAPGYPGTLAQLLPVHARLAPAPRGHRWPGADEIARQLVTLPTHSLLTARDRLALVSELAGYAATAPI